MSEKLMSSEKTDGMANTSALFEQGQHAKEQHLIERMSEANNDKERFSLSLEYGELLMKMERWEDASDVLIRSAEIALRYKDSLWLALAHEKLGDVSAAEGNWFGALHHYRYAIRTMAALAEHSIRMRLETKIKTAQNTLHATILTQEKTVIPLSREFSSRNLAISFVHRDIFLKKYFARCLECNFCHDWCCSFGADIDIQNVEKIQQRKEEILPFVRPPEGEWFEPEYTYYEEYAGNQYTRINPLGPRCAFISKDQRGCGLHRYAISQGMDYHEIKPLACILFPLSFEEGLLFLAPELEDGSLVCSGSGDSVYRAMRDELKYYFGNDFVEELDTIAENVQREK